MRVPEVSLDFPRQWIEFVNPEDEDEIFRCDLTWLLSSWTCIFGNGCKGIIKKRADDGCCSHGAYYSEKADEKRTEKFARRLTEDEWQYRKQGLKGGITEVEDGSPFRPTRTVGLCNGSMGYIPTRRAYAEGGYEAGYRSARYEPDTGHQWATKAGELLKGLNGPGQGGTP